MIYKLRLSFDYPLALGNVSKWARFRLLLVHYFLALGFLIHPTVLLFCCALSAFVLGAEMVGKSPFKADNIKFGWQRVAVAAIVASTFLGLYAHGHAGVNHWWWVSLAGIGFSLYDGYLVWRGVTGPFYIKIKT